MQVGRTEHYLSLWQRTIEPAMPVDIITVYIQPKDLPNYSLSMTASVS